MISQTDARYWSRMIVVGVDADTLFARLRGNDRRGVFVAHTE
jgi:hypothetical protein